MYKTIKTLSHLMDGSEVAYVFPPNNFTRFFIFSSKSLLQLQEDVNDFFKKFDGLNILVLDINYEILDNLKGCRDELRDYPNLHLCRILIRKEDKEYEKK